MRVMKGLSMFAGAVLLLHSGLGFGEETPNGKEAAPPARSGEGTELGATTRAFTDVSHLTNVYAAFPPDAGEACSPEAERAFRFNEPVWLVTDYYNSGRSNNKIVWVVMNTAGRVVYLATDGPEIDPANTVFYWCHRVNRALPRGSYVLQTIIFGAYTLMSPNGYPFVIE
jgi:hypothetical protein